MEISAGVVTILVNLLAMVAGFVVVVFVMKSQLRQLATQVKELGAKVTPLAEEFAAFRENKGHNAARLCEVESRLREIESHQSRIREKIARMEGESFSERPGTSP